MTQGDFREQDVRARKQIRDALRETLFVEAGAGTGKTSALVDRIVALVCEGTPIEQIAAITFTERAAAELRERVRSKLEQAKAERAEKAGVIGAALESLDRAQISTIHAFCQAIVRTYAPEAGVDPDFEVQDEVLTERRMQERWRRYLEALGEDESARKAVDRLLSLGLRTGELEELALGLASRGEIAEMLERSPLSAGEPVWPDLSALRESLASLHAARAPAGDKLRQRIESAEASLKAVMAGPPDEREELLAAGAPSFNETAEKDKGQPNNWGGRDARDDCLEELVRVCRELNKLLSGLRAAALSTVTPRLLDFVRTDERARGRDGSLTFDDLILRARRLLAEDAGARESLRERYRALLIDEFQDTDPLQVQIATAFATDPASGKVEPGRLFLVGDPKQSIYRFRRADMATYAHTEERMRAADARFPELALNRRSRPVILDWVNAVFERIIGQGIRGVQSPYAAIHAQRENGDLRGPGVATVGGEGGDNARNVRTIEARQIAALCRQAQGNWQVVEGEAVRDAKFRDIAILIPRRTGLIALERELAAAGVPYRVESGSLIYRTQEVRDLVNCLTAIDDPADEVAIVAALRSPAFACSDVDLARHRAAGGRFNYHHPKLDEWTGPVADGLRALRSLHESRHNTSLAALAERFVYARGTIETGILDQGDRNSFRRARFVIERARAFESAGPESLRAFVSWLENQSQGQILDNEGASVDDDEDAVRVLTVHGAKGSEFPIVFLAGLSAAPMNNQRPPYNADFAGENVAVCVGTKTDNRRFILGDFEKLDAVEKQHQDAEFDRLLYVATTRARDHLVVFLNYSVNAKGASSAARRLIDARAQDLAQPLEVADAGARRSSGALEGLPLDPAPAGDAETFARERAELLTQAKTLAFTSATALKQNAEAGADEKPERDDESEPWSRGRAATRVGRAVHAAIQSLRFDADDAMIAAVARAEAVAEAVPHREADIARLVDWVVRESGAWKRALAAKRALREVPFALVADGKVLEGYVDMVLETDDGLEIIDWKTDAISGDQVRERLEQYELQAGLYVHGLETATGQHVTKVTYVFATPKVEEQMGDPAALRDAAVALLTATRVA
jgi:ATP-dependent helicase/nuclease subunit A